MTWEPTEEEMREYREAAQRELDALDEDARDLSAVYRTTLLAAWAVSPGPGLEHEVIEWEGAEKLRAEQRDAAEARVAELEAALADTSRVDEALRKLVSPVLARAEKAEARVAELERLVGGWYTAARVRGLCPSSYGPGDPFYPEGEILGRGETARLRARVAELEGAAEELLEVADLRGETELPHPSDDPVLWSARMQTAWDELRSLLTPTKEEGR